MDSHFAELNVLNKDAIEKFERTKIHSASTMTWLRTRCALKAKLRYLFFPEELNKHCEINDLFRGFDADGSGTIDPSELVNMFKDNGIFLSKEQIEAIFSLIDANGDRNLNLSEFKRSVFSDKVNTSFAGIMREFRAKKALASTFQSRRRLT